MTFVIPLPGGRTVRGYRRSVVVTLMLALAAAAVTVWTIASGSYHLSSLDALGTLIGGGSPTDRFIVLDQRLPRALAALAVGSALGVSGALFQSLSRNPLGSPDVVGFTTGAASGGLAILLVGSAVPLWVSLGAISGGLTTALLVYALTATRGVTGERLVLVGLGVGAMLASVNDYLLTRADLESAEAARAWQIGSLNVVGWAQTGPLLVALAVLLPIVAVCGRPLHALELGDDIAAAHGVRVARWRLILLVIGVALAGIAVATAGPISFLALAAPQLALRLTRTPGAAVAASGAMGALLLVGGDLVAQRALAPFQIPVGLVTGALGGAYLLWLLSTGPRT